MRNAAVLFIVLGTLTGAARLSADEPKGYLIQNATVIDGTGKPGFKGSVLIRGDKIAGVGEIAKSFGAAVIDGTGLVVCPGFIDLHTHCDNGLLNKTGRANANYVAQGVTTVVTGNCGSGPVDFAKYSKQLEDGGGIGTNLIHQAPHNSIRQAVMKNENRPPTTEELKKMEDLVAKAMTDGTWGMATGLIYNPGTYAKTDELIALARVAGKHGGHYASHIRNEGGGLLTAIEEAITIGKEGGCPVHVSHIKASGKAAHGLSSRAVALIESARKNGQVVTADQYPYTASSTSLKATLVPTKFREGTEKEYLARLDDPQTGAKIKEEVASALGGRDGGKGIQIARYSKKPEWQGKRVSDIAAADGKEPIDVVMEIEKNGGAQVVNFAMNEEDVRIYMRQPWVATASDGGVQSPGSSVPHPRSYGTFPRKVGLYSIEEKLIPLEQAVRSSSGLPADILRLTDRGYLKPEAFADVLVFDPQAYRDKATFDKPHQYAEGVRWLFVNGKAAIADGKRDDAALAGRVLRHKQKS